MKKKNYEAADKGWEKYKDNLLTIFIMTVSTKKSDASCTNSLSHDNAASFREKKKESWLVTELQFYRTGVITTPRLQITVDHWTTIIVCLNSCFDWQNLSLVGHCDRAFVIQCKNYVT